MSNDVERETECIGMLQLVGGVGGDIKISLVTIFGDVCSELERTLPKPVDVTLHEGGDSEVTLMPDMQEFSDALNQFSKAPKTPDELVARFQNGVNSLCDFTAGRELGDLDHICNAVNFALRKRNAPFYLGKRMFFG